MTTRRSPLQATRLLLPLVTFPPQPPWPYRRRLRRAWWGWTSMTLTSERLLARSWLPVTILDVDRRRILEVRVRDSRRGVVEVSFEVVARPFARLVDADPETIRAVALLHLGDRYRRWVEELGA